MQRTLPDKIAQKVTATHLIVRLKEHGGKIFYFFIVFHKTYYELKFGLRDNNIKKIINSDVFSGDIF